MLYAYSICLDIILFANCSWWLYKKKKINGFLFISNLIYIVFNDLLLIKLVGVEKLLVLDN